MYSRVRASSDEPAGRGPNSTCLRTCSKARAPSIVSLGEAGVGVAPVPVLTFCLGALPEQAGKRSGSVRMRKRTKTPRLFFEREVSDFLYGDDFINYWQ